MSPDDGSHTGGEGPEAPDPWATARERARGDVAAALAPRERRCPECAHVQTGAGRQCERCGADLFARRARIRPGRRMLLAGGLALVVVAVAIVAVVPGLRRAASDEAAAQRARQAALEAAEVRRLRFEVRPRRGNAAPRAGADRLVQRAALLGAAEAAITRDARGRARRGELRGPVLDTECAPYPTTPTRRARERDPAAAAGRYECVAVRRRFPLPELQGRKRTGLSGQLFWVVLDYDRGRYVWCKVSPRAGEGGKSLASVPVPPPCREPMPEPA